ncbi:MAG TPA: hypothetical protein VMT10_09710 [Solirubrobacteraceae bacterium]|nr:hypothetical protein [Solirubrobacteraceae bacterium]
MLRVAVLTALVAASLLSPASALGAAQLTTSDMQPAQSTNLAPTTTSQNFSVVSPCKGQLLQVIVATQQDLGSDGLLLASARVDTFSLTETTPGTYQGSTSATWLQTPGNYFWQAFAPNALCNPNTPDGSPSGLYASGVVGIAVLSPSSPGDTTGTPVDVQDNSEILTINQAKTAVPSVIRKGTRRTGRRVTARCSRHGSGSLLVVFCTTRWTDGKTWTYNGSIRQALNDDGTISARFDGRRAKLSCIKKTARKIDEKRCYKKYHFTAEV